MLELLCYPWPGNVRELKSVALQVAIHGYTEPRARLPAPLAAWFASNASAAGPDAPAAPATPEAPSVRVRHGQMDDAQVLAALERNQWRIRATAEELGISRNSLYALMTRVGYRRAGELRREDILARRRAGELRREDILAAAKAEGCWEPGRLAERLRVSTRGLTLRMLSLGLGRVT